MALNNCTINSGSASTLKDVAIGSLANIILNIRPDDGYVLSASDFTNNTGSLSGIASIVLSNKTNAYDLDNEVIVTVDLDNTFTPSSDVNLVIDIDGDAILSKLVPKTISGTYDTVTANCTVSSQTGVAYTATGIPYSEQALFTKTFTAISNKFFETAPSYVISTGNTDDYSVTVTDVYSSDVYLTARTFTVKAKIPTVSISGDNIDFTAQANGDIVAASAGKIKAVRINSAVLPYQRSTRQIAIYGDVGAQFTLGIVNEDSTPYNFIDLNFINGGSVSATIPSTGSVRFDINIPAVLDDDQYDFTLSTTSFSGSQLSSLLDPDNNQIHTFSIQQLGDITYTVNTDASTDSRTYTSNPSAVHLGTPFFEFEGQRQVTSTLTLTDNADIVLTRLPLVSDFISTNTNSSNSTDSSIDVSSVSVSPATLNGSGVQSVTFTVVSNIEYFGSVASSHTLDVGNFIADESISGGGGFRVYTPQVTGAGGGLIAGQVRASYNPGPSYLAGLNAKSVAIGTPNDTNLYSGTGTLYGNFYGNSVSQITLSISAAGSAAIDNLTITRGTLTGQAPAQNLYYSWTGITSEAIDASSDMTFTVNVALANEP